MKAKFSPAAACLSVLFMIVSGCAYAAPAGGKSETPTLYIAQMADPQTLDPQFQSDTFSMTPASALFDTLIRQDAEGNFIPCLAKSWEYTDDKTIVFHLEENVYFHNGEKMTANDVKFSILRGMSSPHTNSRINFVDREKIRVIDDHTIELQYLYPFAPALGNLAMTQNAIVPESVCSRMSPAEFGRHPVGTGPYRLVEWKTGVSVSMTRFDQYYGPKAKIKNMVFRIITENANRAIELETGGVQFAFDILPADVTKLEQLPDVRIYSGPTFGRGYVGFNNQKPPFNDPRIRKALAHSLDRESIVEAIYHNVGRVGRGPLVAVEKYYYPDVPQFRYDLDLTKKMLDEAGFKGAEVTIYCNQNQLRIDVAEVVQNVWAKFGIKCNINVLEYGAFMESLNSGRHDVVVLGWPGIGDADNPLYSLYHSSSIGATNYTHYINKDVDAMIEKGRSTIDEKEREQIYQDIQIRICEDAPAIFYWEQDTTHAYSKKLRKILYSPYVIRFGELEWAE